MLNYHKNILIRNGICSVGLFDLCFIIVTYSISVCLDTRLVNSSKLCVLTNVVMSNSVSVALHLFISFFIVHPCSPNVV